ncbi:putative complex I intermediate-associated protein 30 [Apostasia shenzhenica]|uniref:Putative complex I intermediate-associated protein 30 n=1 Tax=Apostasia shenzhenica TaxID=1088818 RepID=A0A2I0B231_9ASPA|nr:putative complex I intermediate-associated protein 30 [Apostasia shenzhenica]
MGATSQLSQPAKQGPTCASIVAEGDKVKAYVFAWNIDDLMPPSEKYIFSFKSMEELKKWHLYSDSEYGGLSSASLEIKDGETGVSGIFSGSLSLDVSEDSTWRMKRSGFCGMRSKKFNGFIDLDAYDTIAMRFRGDGRCYISTIYTENWVNSPAQEEDNSWQAFVYGPKDEWHVAKASHSMHHLQQVFSLISEEFEVVQVPLDRYLPTWRGSVIDAELEMNPARIVGMSLSVNAGGGFPSAKTGPGDFRLELDWIKALRT